MPNDLRIYEEIMGLKIRPYVEKVLQCFNCYRFGHLSKHCHNKKICVTCNEEFHGYCDKDLKCANCGGNLHLTDHKCERFQLNMEIKR